MGVDDKIAATSVLGAGGDAAPVADAARITGGTPAVSAASAGTSTPALSPLLAEVAAALETGSMDAMDALKGIVQTHVAVLEDAGVAPLPEGFLEEVVSMMSQDPLLADLLQAAPMSDKITS